MLRPAFSPHLGAAARGLGTGLLLCGLVLGGGPVVGASPRSAALMLAAALAGLALGGAIPARPPRKMASVLAGCLGLGLALALDPGTRAIALLLERIGAAGLDLAFVISGGTFTAMFVIGSTFPCCIVLLINGLSRHASVCSLHPDAHSKHGG